MKIFSIHDSKGECYSEPRPYKNKAEAIRAFEQATIDPQTFLNKYPADYTLVEIAEFSTDTGIVKPHAQPIIIENASSYIQ